MASRSPLLLISNIPTSFVLPKRFLNPLRSLSSEFKSPSKYRTVSTICSSTLGPAIEPSFVICPIINIGISKLLANRISSKVIVLTCVTEPGADDVSSEYSV